VDPTAAAAAVQAASVGSQQWAAAMDDLAEALLAAGDIDQAISTRRAALADIKPELSGTFGVDLANNLGVDLMTRYRQRGDERDLREACRAGEAVWAATPADQRLGAAANLAGRLASLARVTGEKHQLERSLKLISAELAAASTDDPLRPIAVSTLAGTYLQLWQRDGERATLEAGLRTVTDEITDLSLGPEVVNIVGLLAEAAEQSSDGDLLARAEQLTRVTLAASSPATPAERSALHRLLATVLLYRYEWTGSTAALDEALLTSEDAVRHATEGSAADRARALSARAVVRAAASRARGDRPGFAAAVDDARTAHAIARDSEPDDREYVTNLAALLADRYDTIGDSADLDEAIALLDAALADRLPADTYGAVAGNQANNLLARFERDRTTADLDRGIELARAAIAATAEDSAELAARHDTAGRLRAARAHHHHDQSDLAAAEAHAAAAVKHTTAGSPDLTLYLNNWAMWTTERWEQTGSEQALSEATSLLEQALAASRRTSATGGEAKDVLSATIAFNLGVRLQERFEIDREHGHEDLDVLQRAADLFDDVLAAGHPHLTVVAAKRLGDIAWRVSFWPEAEHAFRLALAAAGELAGLRPQRPDKERARTGVQGIGALAALSAVRAGDIQAAAVHLEQASATMIAEAIGIRAESATFDGIVAASARMQRQVLLIGCTLAGGIAVLVGPDGQADHLELPLLMDDVVARRAATFRQILQDAVDGPDADPFGRAAADLAAWTYDVVLAPLTALLPPVGRLAVLPLGRLAWLPLTTAGAPGQTATLGPHEPVLLIRATPRGPTPPPPPSTSPRVVVWGDSGPADRPIPGVIREARRIARVHPGADLRIRHRPALPEPTGSSVLRSTSLGTDATGDQAKPVTGFGTLDELLRADLVHLACHCDVDVDRPQDTVLHLDPPIRISIDPAVLHRGTTHVVLSACDAALTSATLPDEALSAATAFLLAGAGIVTAPLWPVNDVTTPAFMVDYHTALLAGTPPAKALAAVQRRWSASHPLFQHGPWVMTAWPDAIAPS